MKVLITTWIMAIFAIKFFIVGAIDVVTGEYIVQVEGSCDWLCREEVSSSGSEETGTRCVIEGDGIKIGRITFLTLKCEAPAGLRSSGISALESMPENFQTLTVSANGVKVLGTEPNGIVHAFELDGVENIVSYEQLSYYSRLVDLDGFRTDRSNNVLSKLPKDFKNHFRKVFPQVFPSESPSTTPK